MSTLSPLNDSLKPFLKPYLPQSLDSELFVTLTYAASLDSRISASRGQQTVISHIETKTMTHYLRSHHDGILIGVGTALADNPGLDCRYRAKKDLYYNSPRPIIIDPSFKWEINGQSRVIQTAMKGQGLGPWIVVRKGQKLLHSEKSKIVESVRGEVIEIESDYLDDNNNIQWNKLFKLLHKKGLKSVMVEGGATIINQLLDPFNSNCIHSLIITIGPVYLGSNGVQVSPNGRVDLKQVKWWHGIQDSILCAKVN